MRHQSGSGHRSGNTHHNHQQSQPPHRPHTKMTSSVTNIEAISYITTMLSNTSISSTIAIATALDSDKNRPFSLKNRILQKYQNGMDSAAIDTIENNNHPISLKNRILQQFQNGLGSTAVDTIGNNNHPISLKKRILLQARVDFTTDSVSGESETESSVDRNVIEPKRSTNNSIMDNIPSTRVSSNIHTAIQVDLFNRTMEMSNVNVTPKLTKKKPRDLSPDGTVMDDDWAPQMARKIIRLSD